MIIAWLDYKKDKWRTKSWIVPTSFKCHFLMLHQRSFYVMVSKVAFVRMTFMPICVHLNYWMFFSFHSCHISTVPKRLDCAWCWPICRTSVATWSMLGWFWDQLCNHFHLSMKYEWNCKCERSIQGSYLNFCMINVWFSLQ